VRCLVIENELDTSNYICKGLRESGYTVTACNNGVDGLDLATSKSWDIMVLDRMLPGRMTSNLDAMSGRCLSPKVAATCIATTWCATASRCSHGCRPAGSPTTVCSSSDATRAHRKRYGCWSGALGTDLLLSLLLIEAGALVLGARSNGAPGWVARVALHQANDG
jgi:hypothetical protein